ncbi:sugar-binding protein [Pseudomonas viridiflava]|uniref:RHS repeat-associated core domain-containing protein n=1 Tax=Pseudomonas viridiflava TaxID=33069 RepID=UPI0015E43000|nr:RHS repeat-associated core domain-containing protein [Pseudomonas viridiflava]MBA1231636.1 sugar-binding protein [Pseudomonas viridiflava]
MTISTSVHSNAFNFMSFMQSGVDPRTGQYTVSLTLPDVKTNGLRGPGLPLVLSYNPLNTQDSGFGLGWNLRLSQYTPGNQVVSLSSGETFKVYGTQADQLVMPEKKLDSFHFYKQDDTHYRVMHKSGVKEVLETMGASGHTVALPTRILAPEGHSVTLSYTPFGSTHQRLSEVKDDAGQVLLQIRREDTAVHIGLSAADGKDVAFVLRLSGSDHRVTRVEMPTDEGASWRFEYQLVRDHICMTAVDTPAGGHEAVFYQDQGHAFPAKAGRDPLPRVTRHLTTPGSGQAEVDVHYTYADSQGREHNFLGAGLDIAWEDNGLDNLYRYLGEGGYEYVSTETLRVDDVDVRSVKRVFNQFHLLTSETTTQNDAVREVSTAYHLLPGTPFAAQPNDCQLPKEVTTTWRWLNDARAPRSETVTSAYDNQGNLLVETQANGVVETNTWYSAAGEDGCPPDPEGFVRTLKSKTITPAPADHGQAPTLATLYRYTSLAAVMGSEREDWIALESESVVQLDSGFKQRLGNDACALIDCLTASSRGTKRTLRRSAHAFIDSLATLADSDQPLLQRQAHGIVDVLIKLGPAVGRLLKETARQLIELLVQQIPESEQVLQCMTYEYIDDSQDAFQHGRIRRESLSMGGQVTATEYAYSTLARAELGESVQRTVQTVTGFDGVKKTVTLEHSLLNGEPLLNRDDNDVEIRYVYDSLRRVLSETVAPGTEFEATRRYEYQLCATTTDRAEQRLFDVKGVKTCSRFDGLQRVVYEERDDADSPTYRADAGVPRQTYAAVYDALGHLVRETEYDWMGERSLALAQVLEYDDWGEQRSVTGPDGVKTFEETDPVGTLESQGPIQRSWTESTGELVLKSGISETWLNLFEKPTRTVRRGLDGQPLSLSRYHYDGLGRSAEEIVGLTDFERSTRYRYDAFDRVIETTLPDEAIVSHAFAVHSSEDLPVSVCVEHNGQRSVLGEQVYDGLDRMVKSITGGRERSFAYEPGQRQPKAVTTPGGQVIEYDYQPQLGSEPLRRSIFGATATYEYDQHNARLLHSNEQGEQLDRTYYSTGFLKSEKRVSEGSDYTMHYLYSRLGRLQSYTDVLGQEQTYQYDDQGRLAQTSLGTLCSDFTYDALGRTASITTRDSAGGQYVAIILTYDELGREVLRTFDLNGTRQRLAQTYDDVDDMIKRTLSEGEDVLRDEVYGYDPRGRLVRYNCTGTQRPVDAYGKSINQQIFSFDGMDNLKLVMTSFDEGLNRAIYHYEGVDPVQLSRVVNSHKDYVPLEMPLEYDLDGNLILDEAARMLKYDALGRLVEVSVPPSINRYRYGPQDTLAGRTLDGNPDVRFYRDERLVNLLDGSQNRTFMQGNGQVLAQLQGNEAVMLAVSDSQSVLADVQTGDVNLLAYTAYGHRSADSPPVSTLAFNGEYVEPDTGWQLLGNGYRAYNPALMRFHSPDSLSPFGEGGLNGYAYCEGDPVNLVDPDGHSPWGALIRLLKAPLSSAANKAIPKAFLKNSTNAPVSLRKMTPKAVRALGKKAKSTKQPLDDARDQLSKLDSKIELSRLNHKSPSRQLVSDHSAAEEAFDNYNYLYGEAQRDFTFAQKNIGKRVITQEARSGLRAWEKKFDISEAIYAQNERIRVKNYLNTRSDLKGSGRKKNYLGVDNQD